MKKIALPIGFLLLLCSHSANAGLVDMGSYVYDTDSNIEWLRVTETTGMSYNDVYAELGAGGAYEGWRYATINDFEGLLASQGYTPHHSLNCDAGISYCGTIAGWSTNFEDTADYRSVLNIINMLGNNPGGIYPTPQATGFLANEDPNSGNHYLGFLGIDLEGMGLFPCEFCAFGGIYDADLDNDLGVDYTGSYLIRDRTIPVPESSSFAFFLLGMMFLQAKRKKTRTL